MAAISQTTQFKCIFLNENARISLKISLKFIPKGSINNIPALDQIMAWCLVGTKPLSEPMMVRLLTHICVSRPQWLKESYCRISRSFHEIWISDDLIAWMFTGVLTAMLTRFGQYFKVIPSFQERNFAMYFFCCWLYMYNSLRTNPLH